MEKGEAMTVQGTVINGTIVLDANQALPEGARVSVTVEAEPGQQESLRDVLMKYAGCMKGLPPDMAEQHDHYIHGTPKR
jgi:hypothetical protein